MDCIEPVIWDEERHADLLEALLHSMKEVGTRPPIGRSKVTAGILCAGSVCLQGDSMGPIGHCGVGFAAEPIGRRVPLGVLVFATTILAVLAIAFTYAGIEGAANRGNPWSHGLCISVLWSGATALGCTYLS